MVQIVFPWSVYLFHCSKKVYVLVMLPNREISVTGTAPCSTGTGYSTNTVRWPSWYCPTFSLPIHFVPFFCQFMLRTFDVPLFTEWCDMMLLLFWWAGVRRCGDGFTMLLNLSIAIVSPTVRCLHYQYCNGRSPSLAPPPTDAPNAGDPTGPLRIGNFIIEGADRVLVELSDHVIVFYNELITLMNADKNTIPVMPSRYHETLPVW
jgi:hypothetical protein